MLYISKGVSSFFGLGRRSSLGGSFRERVGKDFRGGLLIGTTSIELGVGLGIKGIV